MQKILENPVRTATIQNFATGNVNIIKLSWGYDTSGKTNSTRNRFSDYHSFVALFHVRFSHSFLFFYLPAHLFSIAKAKSLQKLIHDHMRYFFKLTKLLVPRTELAIKEEVRKMQSWVIVCNHLSYLDTILLVSLFTKQCAILKSTFFRIPILGWF